jgi:diguanylate cyclase (GGDEF)-like protein/PAS domain S-box-containing protein
MPTRTPPKDNNNSTSPITQPRAAFSTRNPKVNEEISRRNEERYRDLFENANDLIYTHDLDGNFTSLNRAGERITGYSREEALRLNISDIVAPEFLGQAKAMIAKKVAGKGPTTYELEIIPKTGKRKTLELSTRLISSGGLAVGIQGIARDITARRQAETSLHNTVSLLASTLESTADGIVVLGLDRNIVTCNQKFIAMWQVDPQLIENKDGRELTMHLGSMVGDGDRLIANFDNLFADPMSKATELIELKDGRKYECYYQPQILKGKAVGRVCCFRDITKRNEAEEKLRFYALHDSLTQLPNRTEFMDHLREAVDRAQGNKYARFAVLFLDLDRFKVINDSLGHGIGDKLLIAIAERLKACVRPGDVVARFGGDEFTILLNRTGEISNVINIADRLQAKLAAPFKIGSYEVFTSASIGIVASGSVPRRPEGILRDADAAMYCAKEAGKARYVIFDSEMHIRNINLLQIETDLRHAIQRGEFEALYQPIVDLVSGEVREFEALIRWQHPKLGLISPGEFVSVAEETGLIVPIGKWILEESCRQIADWQKHVGFDLSVSVNLSAKQLIHPALTSQVKDALFATGLNASQLKLEVTESMVMEHRELSLKILTQLDEIGVALSTDDFGTGYSSLSYLQNFPFKRLKIDRSFVNLLDRDEKSKAIVKTILMLGENLDIHVVAEGIETTSQLEILRSLGCISGQGFLFSRPIDSEAIRLFLESGANVFSADPQLKYQSQIIQVADVQ